MRLQYDQLRLKSDPWWLQLLYDTDKVGCDAYIRPNSLCIWCLLKNTRPLVTKRLVICRGHSSPNRLFLQILPMGADWNAFCKSNSLILSSSENFHFVIYFHNTLNQHISDTVVLLLVLVQFFGYLMFTTQADACGDICHCTVVFILSCWRRKNSFYSSFLSSRSVILFPPLSPEDHDGNQLLAPLCLCPLAILNVWLKWTFSVGRISFNNVKSIFPFLSCSDI